MPIGVDYKAVFNISKASKYVSDVDLIKAEVELLVNMQKHSLFFGNGIGLDCEKYISLTNRLATFNLIKSDIEDLFKKYRRVKLVNVEMTFVEADNSITIDLTLSVDKRSLNTFMLSFSLSN